MEKRPKPLTNLSLGKVNKLCIICGAFFVPASHNHVACSKECQKQRAKQKQKEWRTHNKDRCNELSLKYQANQRDKFLTMYGGKCSCCGESEKVFLTLDHIQGGGRAELKGQHTKYAYVRAIQEYDPMKYQILCWNCNSGRQLNGGMCPHQVGDRQ